MDATTDTIHTTGQIQQLEPWFPPSPARDIYLSLLHTDPQPPPTLLRAALITRAASAITSIITLREQKPALALLSQKGSVPESLQKEFDLAERWVNGEVQDIVLEAEGWEKGWGQVIFQTAGEVAGYERLRGIVKKHEEMSRVERARYDAEMKEKGLLQEKPAAEVKTQ
ncbi:Translocation protein S66 [Saitoella coloradoensis]